MPLSIQKIAVNINEWNKLKGVIVTYFLERRPVHNNPLTILLINREDLCQ